jgi:hypothetical protein
MAKGICTDMKRQQVLSIVVGIAVLIVGVYLAINRPWFAPDSSVKTAGLNVPPQATEVPHFGTEYGAITDTLTSPDNVTFQIVAVQRDTSEWLFHIRAHNNGTLNIPILDTATSHYFMIGGRGTPGIPMTADQAFLKLTPLPSSSADLAVHPSLAATVAPSADSDGWLVADLSNYTYQPYQLLYVYGTVTAPACTDPQDQSTCQPSIGYRTIVWNL